MILVAKLEATPEQAIGHHGHTRPKNPAGQRSYAYLLHMQIQINTDKNIAGNEALADHVRSVVEKSLEHYADRLSRVEVHLGDMNADKTGQHDHSCTMEARPKGMEPVAATHKAANSHLAVEGAAQSLANLLRTRFGKLDQHKGTAAQPFQDPKN